VGVVSRRDLAAAMADTLGLGVDEIADALDRRFVPGSVCATYARQILQGQRFNAWDDEGPSEDDEARGLLEREIWDDLTDGAPWPWGAS